MAKPRIPRYIPLALAIIGAATIITGIAIDDSIDPSDIRVIGLVAVLTGMGWLGLRRSMLPSHAAYALGHKEGSEQSYDKGYVAGRAVARPTIVPSLTHRSCRECQRREAAAAFEDASADG